MESTRIYEQYNKRIFRGIEVLNNEKHEEVPSKRIKWINISCIGDSDIDVNIIMGSRITRIATQKRL